MARPVTADVFTGPALSLLLRLEADGFDLMAAGDRLRVRPPARLTPDLLAALAQHKADVLLLLRCRDPDVQARATEFRRQLAAAPAPTVPAFLFRLGMAYVKGACFSCGEPLPELRFGRCWRCALAWRLACQLPVPVELAAALDAARVA